MNVRNVVGGRANALFLSKPRHNALAIKNALMKCEYVKDVSDGNEYIKKLLASTPPHGLFRIVGGDINLDEGFFCKLEASPKSLLSYITSVNTMPKFWAEDEGHTGESAEQWIREVYEKIGFPLDKWQASVWFDGRIVVYYRTLCSSIESEAFKKGIGLAVSLLEAEAIFVTDAFSEAFRKSGLKVLYDGFSPSTDTFFYFDLDAKKLDHDDLKAVCPPSYLPTPSIGSYLDGQWVAVRLAQPHMSKYRFCVNGNFEQRYLADIAGDMLVFYQLLRARRQTIGKIVCSFRREKLVLRQLADRHGRRSFWKNLVSADTLPDRRRVGSLLNRIMLRRATILELEELVDKVARRRSDWQEVQLADMLDIAGISDELPDFERSLRAATALAGGVADYGSSVKDILDSRSNEVLYFWTIAASIATIIAIAGILR
jgi:hypothetical protein